MGATGGAEAVDSARTRRGFLMAGRQLAGSMTKGGGRRGGLVSANKALVSAVGEGRLWVRLFYCAQRKSSNVSCVWVGSMETV